MPYGTVQNKQGSLMSELLFLIALACIALIVFLRLFFWLYVFPGWWKKSRQAGSRKTNHHLPPVSVIIAARNEEENLSQNLPFILEQDYPEFEVIVVDDCSDDKTREVLDCISKKSGRLYVTWVPESGKFRRGKKVALSIGIRAASHEHLVFIDADCHPAGKYWLRYMAEPFHLDKEIVLGYGAYGYKRGLLNALVRYDTLLIAMMYGGMATRIKPYMGVGRNLAYKKSLWINRGGFRGFNNVVSGDDDLFVNAVADKDNTQVILLSQSKTISEPPSGFKQWVRQKTRHMTSSKFYRTWQRILLVAEPFSRILTPFVMLGFYLLFPSVQYLYILAVMWLLLKLVQVFVLHKSMQYTGEKKLLFIFPVIDIILPFFYFTFALAGLMRRNNKLWK
jgi:poly-beta-1,6-N-acetyl-D-glucosamine synthase